MLWKKQLPLLIAFLAGTLFFFQYFIPARVSEDSFQLYLDWVIVIGVFTAILGYYSIIRVHIVKIMKKTRDWYFSLITVVCIIVMVVAWLTGGLASGSVFDNMYTYVLNPIEATIFSLLAFYIASAAYRSFRARNAQATALLIAAIIVMLGRVPIGAVVEIKGYSLVDVANWILNVPNMAAKRGIGLGIGLGSLLLSFKIILGIERGYLGGSD